MPQIIRLLDAGTRVDTAESLRPGGMGAQPRHWCLALLMLRRSSASYHHLMQERAPLPLDLPRLSPYIRTLSGRLEGTGHTMG